MLRLKFRVGDRVFIDRKKEGTIVRIKRCVDYFFMVRCDKTGKIQAYLPNELKLLEEKGDNE